MKICSKCNEQISMHEMNEMKARRKKQKNLHENKSLRMNNKKMVEMKKVLQKKKEKLFNFFFVEMCCT